MCRFSAKTLKICVALTTIHPVFLVRFVYVWMSFTCMFCSHRSNFLSWPLQVTMGDPKSMGTLAILLLPSELFKTLNIIRTRKIPFRVSFQFNSNYRYITFYLCVFNFFCYKVCCLTLRLFHLSWSLACFRGICYKTMSKWMLKSKKCTSGFYLCYL